MKSFLLILISALMLFILFFLNVFAASAQHQISGTVKDASDGAPVPFATAALLLPDTTAVAGVMTGDDGRFVIGNVAAGDYMLQVSFIGYERLYRSVNVPAQSDLGDIFLAESANRLEEVVVSVTRPLVVSRADRYIVNVSGNIQSAGRDAMDILRNTPGILVDHRGNISALGNNVQIWIDGRPSRMDGGQLRTFLNSMQGDEIDRIEIITNPSSRYDAAGSGGIIDIRTKRGLQFGANGTITAGYRQGRADRQNVGVNANWRREKFNVFGNYSIIRLNIWDDIHQTNVMQTPPEGEITLDQRTRATSAKADLYHNVRAGTDFFLNQNNILGVIVSGYYAGGGRVKIDTNTDIAPDLSGVGFSTSNNIQTAFTDGIQINMNYQSTFSKTEQQLNFDLDYARFGSAPFQETHNRYYNHKNGSMTGGYEGLQHSNTQVINVYSAKIDYTQPLWEDANMETGAKSSHSKTDNDLKYNEFIGGIWRDDTNRTNHFIYTEQVHAAYINVNQTIGKFNLQAGLRGEYTLSEGEQRTIPREKNDTTYFNLFPTFFVNYEASPQHTFGISYSRRLNRPSYWQLNPFETTLDAYTFERGNPYLTPAYTHNLQFSHTYSQSLMTRIVYRHTTDMMLQEVVEDAATQRYGWIYNNFGKNKLIYAMVNYSKTLLKIWTVDFTVMGFHSINTSQRATGEFTNNGSAIYVQLNNDITITPTLSAEVTGMYSSKERLGYYVVRPSGNLSFGLRQILFNNKLTVSLTVNDILNTNGIKLHQRFDNVDLSIVNQLDLQYANLTLRYNFGSTTVRAARNKTTGIEDEASRAGR